MNIEFADLESEFRNAFDIYSEELREGNLCPLCLKRRLCNTGISATGEICIEILLKGGHCEMKKIKLEAQS